MLPAEVHRAPAADADTFGVARLDSVDDARQRGEQRLRVGRRRSGRLMAREQLALLGHEAGRELGPTDVDGEDRHVYCSAEETRRASTQMSSALGLDANDRSTKLAHRSSSGSLRDARVRAASQSSPSSMSRSRRSIKPSV